MSCIELNRTFIPISKDHEFDENDFDYVQGGAGEVIKDEN